MAELVPTAGEAEWLEARRKGVTASEIAIIMGLSPYSSPYALYHQKLGILPADADSPEMERGRVLEPYIREKFADAHPGFAVMGDGRSLYRNPARPWQMATPDSTLFATGAGGFFDLEEPVALLECKVDGGSDEWGEEGTDEIPVHYRAQALWQMDVMGVSRVYVDCLDPARWRIRRYLIEHDPAALLGYDVSHALDATGELCSLCGDILAMRVAAVEFLDAVGRQEPPDVDWRPATIGALKRLHPSVADEDVVVGVQLRTRYRAAVKNFKHWEQRKHLYEAQLRQRMGSARRAISESGVPVARRDVYEVGESVRRAYTVDKLVAVPPRAKRES